MYINLDFNEEINEKNGYFCTHKYLDSVSINKGWEIINHAYSLLQFNNNSFREDIISNLRKAMNYRIKDLFEILNINKINFSHLSNKMKIEKLEALGLIKKTLLNKLLKLRNSIEYDGKNAPSNEECEEFIDVVWYFYKTTDIYCSIAPESFDINYAIEDIEYSYEYNFDFKNHTYIKFHGRMPEELFSKQPKSNNSIKILNFRKKIDTNTNNSATLYHDAHLAQTYFEGKINIKDIPEYYKVFGYILRYWNKF
ncbi:MAG: hypothetical protein IKM43_00540 [Clostridia bacterium]|nr:hypothetical protein [Clostridia bacterium]